MTGFDFNFPNPSRLLQGVLLTLMLGLLILPAQAFKNKVAPAFPVSNYKSRIPGPMLVKPTKPGEKAQPYSAGDYLHSVKEKEAKLGAMSAQKRSELSSKTGTALKRYEIQSRYERTGLTHLKPIEPINDSLSSHWVAPLPETGHNYLRDYYKN